MCHLVEILNQFVVNILIDSQFGRMLVAQLSAECADALLIDVLVDVL